MNDFIELDLILGQDEDGIMSAVTMMVRPEVISMYCGSVEDPNITLVWFDPEGNSRLVAEPVEEFREKMRMSRF